MRVLFFVPLLLLSTSVLARTWTDVTGTFTIEADLDSVENDAVVLLRESDKKQIRIPLAKLSKADQEFVKSLGNAPKADPLVAQPAESKKPRIPSRDENAKAEASIDELFKKELASRDKNLGEQLLKLALETKNDNASQYALLRKAIEVAAASGDSKTVCTALDTLESSFNLNVLPIWVDALGTLSKRVDDEDKITAIIEKAYSADDYDSAVDLANISLASAKNANDPVAVKNAAAKVNEVTLARDEFKKIAVARQKIAETPSDPEANRVVGSFICFIKKDWGKGVPMLALADDPTLKAVAQLDVAAKDALVIGDAWMRVKGGQDRAVFWYKQALPELTGLTKVRVEKSVASLSPAPHSVDLLGKVDVEKGAIFGKWFRTKEGIVGEQNSALMLAGTVEGSYELIVDFTRLKGNDGIGIIFPVGSNNANFGMSWGFGDKSGLEMIDGMGIADKNNPTVIHPGELTNGKKHSVAIRVINAEISSVYVTLDGHKLAQWSGKSTSLDIHPDWRKWWNAHNKVGIVVFHAQVRLESMKVIQR